jgi:hypothetical protein
MRVFAYSDTHCDLNSLEKVKKGWKDADLIIFCGDFSRFRRGLEEVCSKVGRIKNLLVIPGNNETSEDIEEVCKLYDWTNLHGRVVKIGRYKFAGCGGSTITPFSTPFELREKDFERILRPFAGLENLILVTHSPPYGILDSTFASERIGSRAIREFIEREKPILNLCGHVHEHAGKEETLGETRVINVGKLGKVIYI